MSDPKTIFAVNLEAKFFRATFAYAGKVSPYIPLTEAPDPLTISTKFVNSNCKNILKFGFYDHGKSYFVYVYTCLVRGHSPILTTHFGLKNF